MPGVLPGIHVLVAAAEVADGRNKSGHDEKRVMKKCRRC